MYWPALLKISSGIKQQDVYKEEIAPTKSGITNMHLELAEYDCITLGAKKYYIQKQFTMRYSVGGERHFKLYL